MNDKCFQCHVFQLGKTYFTHTYKLQITKTGMMHKYNYGNWNLQLPFAIGNQNGTADKCKEVHFKHAVHLVNILSHKNSNHSRQHILIEVGRRKKEFG